MQGSQNNPPISQQDSLQPRGTVGKRNTAKGSPEFIHALHTQNHGDSPGPLAAPLNILAAGNPPRGTALPESWGRGSKRGSSQGETLRFKQREFLLPETFSSLGPGAGGNLSCLLNHASGFERGDETSSLPSHEPLPPERGPLWLFPPSPTRPPTKTDPGLFLLE